MIVKSGMAAAKTKTIGIIFQTLLFSPIASVAALGGIIAWQIWKGKKDSEEIRAKKAKPQHTEIFNNQKPITVEFNVDKNLTDNNVADKTQKDEIQLYPKGKNSFQESGEIPSNEKNIADTVMDKPSDIEIRAEDVIYKIPKDQKKSKQKKQTKRRRKNKNAEL